MKPLDVSSCRAESKAYRLIRHLFPQLSALLAELCDGQTRELGLDLLPVLVHPDEVGRRVSLRLTRKLRLLLLALTLGTAAATTAEKLMRRL